jgi:hypothetical protein
MMDRFTHGFDRFSTIAENNDGQGLKPSAGAISQDKICSCRSGEVLGTLLAAQNISYSVCLSASDDATVSKSGA